MTTTKELQVNAPQSISDIKANIKTIQTVMTSVMKDGEHYGVVPGCGDKKVLLKPGAEKIMATFRIAPTFIVEDLSTSDECRYRVTATGAYSPTGTFLGQGVGECSTNEEKYKWRSAVCDEEFEDAPENRRRVKWKKGGYGKPAYKVKQVREDHADKANTVLKMAVKRALVAMVLIVTAASDIFTQDLEDDGVEVENIEKKQTQDEQQKKFYCSESDCNVEIKQEVYEYSTKNFKKALCFNHQKAVKNGN
jgi:hypothetical protein